MKQSNHTSKITVLLNMKKNAIANTLIRCILYDNSPLQESNVQIAQGKRT